MQKKIAALGAALVLTSAAAHAEVVEGDERGFVTRDEAVVEATPKEVWLALISPAKWWNSSHTFTGDAANLSLTPQAGGCFCEKVPEVDEPGRFTLEGSVEHLRVVNSQPEVAMRLVGALGPLQSEPVTGVLTIAMTEVEQGTRIVWEYHVGGRMRFEVPVIAKAVDGVMTRQLDGLAKLLGRVAPLEEEGASEQGEETPRPEGEEAEGAEETSPDDDQTPTDEVGEDFEDAFGDAEPDADADEPGQAL